MKRSLISFFEMLQGLFDISNALLNDVFCDIVKTFEVCRRFVLLIRRDNLVSGSGLRRYLTEVSGC